MKSIRWFKTYFWKNSPVTMKKGSRSQKQTKALIYLSCKFGKKFIHWPKRYFFRMNQHMILKIGPKSTKPNQLYTLAQLLLNAISLQVSSQPIYSFRIKCVSKSVLIFCPPVTLKIRSPKFIHFFSTYKLYTYVCLALINQAL